VHLGLCDLKAAKPLETEVVLETFLYLSGTIFTMQAMSMLGCNMIVFVMEDITYLLLHDVDHRFDVHISIAKDHIV
jgi:hypothetical protein